MGVLMETPFPMTAAKFSDVAATVCPPAPVVTPTLPLGLTKSKRNCSFDTRLSRSTSVGARRRLATSCATEDCAAADEMRESAEIVVVVKESIVISQKKVEEYNREWSMNIKELGSRKRSSKGGERRRKTPVEK